MYKLFFYLLMFVGIYLNANDKIEIYTSSVELQDNIINAQGGVNVVYKNHLLSANKAIYNKENGDLELFDNIALSYNKQYRILGNYAKLNIVKKEKLFKPFYILEKKSDVWISANEGQAKEDKIDIEKGVVSGCNQINPLWKMQFTSSDYNSQTKWLNIHNTTLYLYDIPILYTPYFGYSLGTDRKTGLLMPSVGISGDEGFYYQQPIYIAEYDTWDLEFNPQLRSERGRGIYSTFRFVDSQVSSGKLKVGYFQENKQYFNQENLYNQTHYGLDFTYRNSNLLNSWFNLDLEGQSGLSVDLSSMNDVDYINLEQNNNLETNTATQVLSRINIFYNTDVNYFATYFKYYQDLTVKNNKDTMHKLPTLHYHSYLYTLMKEHLLYNIDIKTTNIQNNIRTKNKTAQQTDIYIPITLRTSLFDEYLNVSYKANLYSQYTKFDVRIKDTNLSTYSNGIYANNYHEFSLSTELTRDFEDFTHTVSLSAKYQLDSFEMRKGYYKDNKEFCLNSENLTDDICSFYNIEGVDESLDLELIQYLYDASSEEILYHRLAQNISYEESQSTYGELENELDYTISKSMSLYNNMFYNYDEHAFSKVFNKITLSNDKFTLNFSHLYKNLFIEENSYTSYITSNLKYQYNDYYSYKFRYDYDLEDKVKKSREIGFLYEKRCWNFGLSYVENNRPQLTQDGDSSVYDKYLYITIILKPIMTSGMKSSAFGVELPS